ncbi:hypothetical protein GCM10023107_16250 [Actinoplanes octamycinicus]|uniref:hypothetical protein n=1 Tax=Actinoplanes octamycinicus TaxID=135948 RepID=UPI0031EC4C8A
MTYPVLVTAAVVTGMLVGAGRLAAPRVGAAAGRVNPPDLPLPGQPRWGVLFWWTVAVLVPYLLAAVAVAATSGGGSADAYRAGEISARAERLWIRLIQGVLRIRSRA